MSDDPSVPKSAPNLFVPAAHSVLRVAARNAGRLFESLNEGVWERDLVTDEVWYSPRYKSLLGFADDEISVMVRTRTDDELGVAEVMYDPDLVLAGTAEPDELELAERVVAMVRNRFGTVPLYARVDMLRAADGSPVLLELEAIEPNLYFEQAPGSAERLADAIVARAAA